MEPKLTDEKLIYKAAQRASAELGIAVSLIDDHLEFIRFYANLMRLVGHDAELARHWVYTGNRHLGYTPILRIISSHYLKEMNGYLEGILQ